MTNVMELNETKTIIFNDGSKAEMTFEQILHQYDLLIKKHCRMAVQNLMYNKPENDDVVQQMRIAAWKAFIKYEPERGLAFSTYLVYWLQHAESAIVAPMFAQKRVNAEGTVSFDESKTDDGEGDMKNVIGEDDENIGDVEYNDLLKRITSMLNSKERVYFKYFLDSEYYNTTRLGDELGVSRQAAHKQVKLLKVKLQDILKGEDII